MLRRGFLRGLGLLSTSFFAPKVEAGSAIFLEKNARAVWLNHLQKLSTPLLSHLAEDTLKQSMPLEGTENGIRTHAFCNTLEGFGRLMTGISPWLQLEGGDVTEKALRDKYFKLALQGLSNAVNPKANDYMP